jgi:hypothetical protein
VLPQLQRCWEAELEGGALGASPLIVMLVVRRRPG